MPSLRQCRRSGAAGTYTLSRGSRSQRTFLYVEVPRRGLAAAQWTRVRSSESLAGQRWVAIWMPGTGRPGRQRSWLANLAAPECSPRRSPPTSSRRPVERDHELDLDRGSAAHDRAGAAKLLLRCVRRQEGGLHLRQPGPAPDTGPLFRGAPRIEHDHRKAIGREWRRLDRDGTRATFLDLDVGGHIAGGLSHHRAILSLLPHVPAPNLLLHTCRRIASGGSDRPDGSRSCSRPWLMLEPWLIQ